MEERNIEEIRELIKESVRINCGENWNSQSQDEIDGGYGVAMMCAYILGVHPRLRNLCEFLDLDEKYLEVPYTRLMVNGVFQYNSPIGRDSLLRPSRKKRSYYEEELALKAWANIAALASGFLGKGLSREELESNKGV